MEKIRDEREIIRHVASEEERLAKRFKRYEENCRRAIEDLERRKQKEAC